MKIGEWIIACLLLAFVYALIAGTEQIALFIAIIAMFASGANEVFSDSEDENNS